MSSSAGSFVLASFWAARRIDFCFPIASSSARIDFCRPTKSGTTICGKTMMYRSGSNGTRIPLGGGDCGSRLSFRKSIGPPFPCCLRRLGSLLVQDDRMLAIRDDFLRDQHFLDVGLGGNVVHHV